MMDENLRPELKWFAEQMEEKLQRNDYKSPWQYSTIDYLVKRFFEECEELKQELQGREDSNKVIDECVDVANFAMMLAKRYNG